MNNVELTRGIALDIDDTLSATVVCWMKELQKEFGNPEGLTAEEMISKYRYTHFVPYWDYNKMQAWIDEKNIAGGICYQEFTLIEDSHHYVSKIDKILPISCYITARPENCIENTRIWLDKHGFPQKPILAKPTHLNYEESHNWKADTLVSLYPTVTGLVDDNVSIINQLPADYAGTIFLYSHDALEKEYPFTIVPCKTWESVYINIKHLYENTSTGATSI